MDVIQKLIGVVARAFYDDQEIVILDLLSRNDSMRDDQLAGGVSLTVKQLQKSAGKLKEAGLLRVETRWEEIKRKDEREKEEQQQQQASATGGTNTANGNPANTNDDSQEYKKKSHTVAANMGGSNAHKKDIRERKKIQRSYFYIDYKQFVNVVKYKIHKIDRIIQKEADAQTRDVPYKCSQCSQEYSMLEMLSLPMNDEQIPLCEHCNVELKPDMPDIAGDASRKLTRFNEEMKPILELLKKTESFSIPASWPLLQSNLNKDQKKEWSKERDVDTLSASGSKSQATEIVVELQTGADASVAKTNGEEADGNQEAMDEEAKRIAKYYESLMQATGAVPESSASTPASVTEIDTVENMNGDDDDEEEEDEEVFEAVEPTSVIPLKRPIEDDEEEDDEEEEFMDV